MTYYRITFLRDVVDKDNKRLKLPKFIEPGEQVIYFLTIGWPIDQKVVNIIKNINSNNLHEIHLELFHNGIDLNYESDGKTPRDMTIYVTTADGNEFSKTFGFSEIIEPNFGN